MDVTAYKLIRRVALGALRHMPKTRQRIRNVYWNYRGRQFDKLKMSISTQSNIVVFESYMGRSYSCSPRAIYEAMISDERFSNWTLYWSFRKDSLAKIEAIEDLQCAQILIKGSREHFDALAQAKYWVTNSRSEEYVTPKSDQVYIQCWHGTPLKRLGYDIAIETSNALNTTNELAGRYGIEASKWTYLVSPSPFTTDRLLSCFGLGDVWRSNVLEVGYPRNDRLARLPESAGEQQALKTFILDSLGVHTEKKILLYAPTWRDNEYKAGVGYIQNTLIDFDLLQKRIGNEWVILFRPHYFIANKFDFSRYEGFVYDVSQVSDINDLYLAADALLTDYSSVFFDYANTKRPILFFWPDFEHYAGDIRGFYFNPRELPGPHCYTTEEVAQAINALDEYETAYGTEYAAFLETFCPKDDGHAAERVVDAVFGAL